MTTPAPQPGPRTVPAEGTAGQVARERWRRSRWAVLVGVVVLLAAAVAALSVPRGGDRARLGPDNPEPDGSRAVVQVLRRQGVDVRQERTSRTATDATGPSSSLVVTGTRLLGPTQLERLAADDVAALILVEPDEFTLSRLAPRLRTAGMADPVDRNPECTDRAAVAAGRTRAGGSLYSTTGPGAVAGDAVVCYPVDARDGSYVVIRRGGRTITVIGQSDGLTNRYAGEDGNAALALRTLGAQPELVWYTPDPLELAAGQEAQSLSDLLPDWVLWVVVQLVLAVLVAMAWRARRLGRLVPEPLPVIVRAAETQEGRARLYRQASARGRAAATLRTTTLRRLANRLAAPAGTTPERLVALAAAATGRDEHALHRLLLGRAPENDGALVSLADELDAVEQDLSHPHSDQGAAPT
jgi:hypothetical protein